MGNLRLYGATSGYTEIAPPAVAPDGVLSLPSGTGTIAKTTDQGLVHINTTTFSAVASVSLNDVFTSAYENYLIQISGNVASGEPTTTMRLRLAGTDDSTASSYVSQEIYISNTSVSGTRTTATSARLGEIGSTLSGMQLNVYSPALATRTAWRTLTVASRSGALIYDIASTHNQTVAYDGFTFSTPSSTLTGTIRVYGYKNS